MYNYKQCSSNKLRLETYWRNVDQMGVGNRPARVYDSTTTTCAKSFITYIWVTVPPPTVLAANVYETGIFHRHLVPHNRYQPLTLHLPFVCSFHPLPHPKSFKLPELYCTRFYKQVEKLKNPHGLFLYVNVYHFTTPTEHVRSMCVAVHL